MSGKAYSTKWGRRTWAVLFTIIVAGLVAIAIGELSGRKDDVIGPVSKAEPPGQQDGTAAHPYANSSQCPASVDLVVWPRNDRPIPNIPPGISVCFVGDQAANDGGPQLQVRDR
jgi:hypothetical protein